MLGMLCNCFSKQCIIGHDTMYAAISMPFSRTTI